MRPARKPALALASPTPQPLRAPLRLWRISAWPGLDGIGGQHADGRWHSRPRNVIYCAEHPALAALEVLAHMRLPLANIPLNLKLIAIDVAQGALLSPPPELPTGWQANRIATAQLGNHWLDQNHALLLKLPSATIPHACNYLINPRHPDARHLLGESLIEPFWFDARHLPPR